MNLPLFAIYLISINIISGIFFVFDKKAAQRGHRRVPERTLHLLELCGGVFITWLLMYIIRHKNCKFSYYAITYLLLAGWIASLLFKTDFID